MVATGQNGHNASAAEPPVTLAGALERVSSRLDAAGLAFGHGTDNAWDEAVQLGLGALGLDPHSGDEVLEVPLEAADWQRIQSLADQRVEQRVPLAYLLGTGWFAGLEFLCDQRALVPRSPLAELIVEDYAPWWSGAPPDRILDLCCGGGCIGIAAACHAPQAQLVLADIDRDALALAQENVRRHAVGDRVAVRRSDLFDDLAGERFDLILCNPPYVDARDIAAMPAEYRHEPLHALAAGGDGLDLALRILARASAHLSERGLLFLEVGNSWEALDALLPELAFTWLEFSAGGHGVLCISAAELRNARQRFETLADARGSESV